MDSQNKNDENDDKDFLENFYNSINKESVRKASFVHRGPMNQAQFDEKFDYNKPEAENKLKKHSKKFFNRYYEPFTSVSSLRHFILDLVPILKWLPNYNWKTDLASDFIGGITIGVLHVPQGIAYALLAKQAPIMGLYTSLITPLIYMIFGTSRDSSVGTFAVISLMTGIAVERICGPQDVSSSKLFNSTIEIESNTFVPTPQEVSCAIALTMGLILLIMGFLRLQFLTTYLSDQVIAGFTIGASVHVLVSQLKMLFGIRGLPKHSGPFYILRHLLDLTLAIPRANLVSCSISIVSIFILYCGKEYINLLVKKKTKSNIPIPWELVVVVLAALFVYLTKVNEQFKVHVVQAIPTGLPSITVPRFSLIVQVLPDAISMTIVSISVWLSISKMLAKKNGYDLDSGQELFALSFCSIISSFFPTIPISCSLSRTLVALGAGVATQLSTVSSSILVLLVVLFLGPFLETLPMCVLASIIVVALQGMFKNCAELPKLWKLSKIDFTIWVVACLSTIIIDVSEGLLISVTFALFTTILREQYPKWHLLASIQGTQDFKDAKRYGDSVYFKGICIFRFDAPLLFHNVECFKKSVEKAYCEWQKSHEFYVLREERETILKPMLDAKEDESAEEKATDHTLSRHFVIDCSGFTFIDLMGVSALKEIFSDMRKRGILVCFANVKVAVREMFGKCDFFKFVPKENFYPTMRDAITIARQRQTQLGFEDTGYVPEFDRLTEVLSSHPM